MSLAQAVPVTIEGANPADLPGLVLLLQALFAIEQDFQPAPEKQLRGLETLLSHPQTAHVAVARSPQGRVIGMATVQLVISTAEGAPSAWIEDVVVDASYRGQGLGADLLGAVLAWARTQGATRAQLLADLDNIPALGFYAHQGWQGTRLGAWRIAL